MKLLCSTLAALAAADGIKVEMTLCTEGDGVLTNAQGGCDSLSLTVPNGANDLTQTVSADGYCDGDAGVITANLPSGTLNGAAWFKFDYDTTDTLCLEKLTITDVDDPTISYNVIQDVWPNSFDPAVQNPGWTSGTNEKLIHFRADCNKGSAAITKSTAFLQSCILNTGKVSLTPVNECETGDNMCDDNATCTDTPSSYTCACPAGWTGTGLKLDPSRTSGDTRGCFPPPGPSVDKCNDANGIIEMTATLRTVVGNYGQNQDGVIVFPLDQLTSSFDSDNNLVMTKVLGGDGCTKITVDGVEVCSEVDETVTLKCKYTLDDQNVSDNFQVTGQDTAATAEGTGTLDYTLTVEDNKNIGDTIKFTITPKNPGLVYATVKSCDVTKDNDKLTIVGHGDPHCTNPVVSAAALTNFFTSQNNIEGTWTAFKWSTTEANNVEDQGLTCTIGLSENASTAAVNDCSASNA